jgi:hypothetical protein
MKTAKLFSVLLALILLVTATASPAAARSEASASLSIQPLGAYSCALVKQAPADWVKMKPRQSFDMFWTVQNTGAIWPASSTRLVYLSGAKMQTAGDSFNLAASVGRGGKVKLGVDMIAPKTPGTYTSTWGLYAGNTRICRVYIIVTVAR